MNSDLPYAHPQPYSRHLRIIAGMIARRESDTACIDRITRFLEQCGVPVETAPIDLSIPDNKTDHCFSPPFPIVLVE